MFKGSRAHPLIISAVALSLLLVSTVVLLEESSADDILHIELVDAEGHQYGEQTGKKSSVGYESLFNSDIEFSTENNSGTITYISASEQQIRTNGEPYIRISGGSGLFNLYISVSVSDGGSMGYLGTTGLNVDVTLDGRSYRAVLNDSNHYESYLKDASGQAAELRPGVMYPLTFTTNSEYRSSTEPASASGLTFTFGIDPTADTRTITFVSAGETVTSRMLLPTDQLGTLPEVSRQGFDFLGWFDSSDHQVYANTLVSAIPPDNTITAHWQESKRTVTFLVDGSAYEVRELYPSERLGSLPSPTKEGYELTGWFDSSDHQVTSQTLVSDLQSLNIDSHWREAKHTISFVSEGEVKGTKELYPEEALGTFPDVSKEGYDLVGWFDSDDHQVYATTLVSELPSDVVTAKWQEKTLTVVFKSDGEQKDTRTYRLSESLGDLPTISKEGYELIGWFDSASHQVTSETLVSDLKSSEINAHWRLAKHTITFVSDGKTEDTRELYPEQVLGFLPSVTKSGFDLVGWFDSDDNRVYATTKVSELSSDVITAKWQEKKRTVTFVSAGDTIDTRTLRYSETLGDLPTVTRDNFEFLGWFDSDTHQVTSTTKVSDLLSDTITAHWKATERTITFISDKKVIEIREYLSTDRIGQLPDVSKDEATLIGWFDSSKREVSESTLVSELPDDTVTAIWNQDLVYMSEGKEVSRQPHTYEQILADVEVGWFPEVTRDGYDLTGWTDSDGNIVLKTTRLSELSSFTLTAQWKEIPKHTISFISDGQVVATKQLLPDDKLGEFPTVTKEGYELTGWFDETGNKVDENTKVSKLPTDTVTALWKQIEKRTISFVSDGQVIATKQLEPKDKLGEFPTVTKEGYELTGWFDETGNKVDENTKVEKLPSDKVTALWKQIDKRTITFISDGQVVATKELYPKDSIGEFPTVTREGYELTGWFDETGTEVKENTKVEKLPSDTVTALWKALEKHTVSFVSNGETVQTKELADSQPLGEFPSVYLDGYILVGWADTEGRNVKETTLVSELPTYSVVAIWYQDEPEPEPEPPEEWPKTTTETYSVQNPDGSTTVTVIERVTQRDGSYTETVTETTYYPDGTMDEKTREESVDPEGSTESSRSTETKEVVNDDGSTTTITTDTEVSKDGSYTETETSSTVRPDGSTEESTRTTDVDSDGNASETSTEVRTVVYDDGSETRTTTYSKTDRDGSAIASEMQESIDQEGAVTDIQKTSVYTDADGKSVEVKASGTVDRIEVTIPEMDVSNMPYVEDSVKDMDVQRVVVGVHSDTGELVVPKDMVEEVLVKGYSISVSDDRSYVCLDEDVVSNLSSAQGDVVLTVTEATEEQMSGYQVETVGGNYAVSITLTVDGEPMSELGGKAEISLLPGYKSASVYYVADDGSKELIESEYDPATGKVQFSVVHFSIYMVEVEGLQIGILHIAIIALAIIIAAIIIFKLRARRDAS